MLLVEFYYSFSLCFQLAAAWSKGNRDQSQRYTLLCASIRERKGWEPKSAPLLLGALGCNSHQDWPEVAWNPIKKCTHRRHTSCSGLKPLKSFHGSWVLTPCGMTNLLLENPAWQTCQASTRENWLWSPHRKPGPRAHDREVLRCTKAHSCLDMRNVIWEGEAIWKGNVNSCSLLEKLHWKHVLSEYANLFQSKLWECVVFIFSCFRRKQNNTYNMSLQKWSDFVFKIPNIFSL